ncbi:hypothetical protein NL676_006041 [Syzygium grande]|nr:hypothetical protein NL676_006041 [Syzygium grande]
MGVRMTTTRADRPQPRGDVATGLCPVAKVANKEASTSRGYNSPNPPNLKGSLETTGQRGSYRPGDLDDHASRHT